MSALRDLCKCFTALSFSSSDTEVCVGEGGRGRGGAGFLLGVTDLNGYIYGTTVPINFYCTKVPK